MDIVTLLSQIDNLSVPFGIHACGFNAFHRVFFSYRRLIDLLIDLLDKDLLAGAAAVLAGIRDESVLWTHAYILACLCANSTRVLLF